MKTVGDDSEAHGGDADHGDGGHRWYDADCDVAYIRNMLAFFMSFFCPTSRA